MPDPGTGQLVAQLLLDSRTWMHRRVESLRMDANGGTRLQVSVDFTLPDPPVHRSKARVLLPLGFVRKGALRKVDTRSASNQPLPILDSKENGELATEMLISLAKQVLPPATASSPDAREQLSNVVFCPPGAVDDTVSQFERWVADVGLIGDEETREVFTSLVEQLASTFLFAVEVDEELVGTRSIVKYSYEDELPDVRRVSIPTVLQLDAPLFAMAASWHFEVQSPPGVGLRRLSVQEFDSDGSMLTRWTDAASGRDPATVAHVACRPEHRFTTAVAEVALAPQRRGLPFVMLLGAVLTGLLVGAGLLGRAFPTAVLSRGATTSSASSILLAGPALLLSWLSRAPEHVMVARLLWPLRRVLVISSFTLFGVAMLIAVPLTSPYRWAGWTLVAVVQAWAIVQAVRHYVSVVRSS